jgi:hypothetical protein
VMEAKDETGMTQEKANRYDKAQMDP